MAMDPRIINKIVDITRIHNAYSIPSACRDISSVKNIHKDQDIYIVAGGPSMNHIDSSFYDNRIVVAVNHSYKIIPSCRYIIAKEDLGGSSDFVKNHKNITLIASLWKYGTPNMWKNEIKYPASTVLFIADDDLEKVFVQSSNILYSGVSTTLTAMHLSAYMGAKNIILSGHDCGMLDGEIHAHGYNTHTAQTPESRYPMWMAKNEIEKQTIAVKEKIKQVYGSNVLSINPFVNLNFEGHNYQPFIKE